MELEFVMLYCDYSQLEADSDAMSNRAVGDDTMLNSSDIIEITSITLQLINRYMRCVENGR